MVWNLRNQPKLSQRVRKRYYKTQPTNLRNFRQLSQINCEKMANSRNICDYMLRKLAKVCKIAYFAKPCEIANKQAKKISGNVRKRFFLANFFWLLKYTKSQKKAEIKVANSQ